ncbi:Ubiquitin-like domain-containing CTD phosphatase 1, partial [Tetrabaena socialis]
MAQVEVGIKWSGKEFTIQCESTDTVLALKHKLEGQTSVLAKRQKILGLKTKEGKPATDESAVGELLIKPSVKFMMMGTPEAAIAAAVRESEAAPEVQDDFDIGADEQARASGLRSRDEQEKLARRIKSVEVKILSPPRPGKKCLVIDIDYTIFDLGSAAERPEGRLAARGIVDEEAGEELARPYLHEFLSTSHEFYDIIIWSATSKKWVEVKMKVRGRGGRGGAGAQ